MNKTIIGIIVAVALGLMIAVYGIGVLNKEASLRNLVEAKQLDNTSEFDNMWKKIQQVAQVPGEKRDALAMIFNGYASARTPSKEGNAPIMNWIKEAVPVVSGDLKVYDNLMNIIIGSRDAWTMRQKELIDISRVHNTPFDQYPASWFLGGRKKTIVTIVTSSKTGAAFEFGKDDSDLGLFPKK